MAKHGDDVAELVGGNPWSGLVRHDDGGCSAASVPAPESMPADAIWHGLPVTHEPLEWSGSVTGDARPLALTLSQHDCLMTLRYRFPIRVVPPAAARDGVVNGVFGYTHRTVNGLLRHGLIRQLPNGRYGITDNGLHALRMNRVRR